MIEEIQKLLINYTKWVQDKTIIKKIDSNWIKIITPHLDRHNDCIQIFARKSDSGYTLSDDGNTINDLMISGCLIDTPKRQELLKITLAGFGIQHNNNELFVNTTYENFPIKKHNLIQAILAVNDLFYLASPIVTSLFFEDVAKWLDASEIRYTPKIKFPGKSGYDHMFDFVIPKSKKQTERIIQTVNNPKKDNIEALVFKWLDTKEVRSSDAKLYAFLNDMDSSISSSVIDALHNYNLIPVPWQNREQIKGELAA